MPLVIFARGAHYALELLSKETEYDVMSLDWTLDPSEARQRTQDTGIVLQGNADPSLLYAEKETIRERVRDMLKGFGPQSHYIANLGHGMHPGKMKRLLSLPSKDVQGSPFCVLFGNKK